MANPMLRLSSTPRYCSLLPFRSSPAILPHPPLPILALQTQQQQQTPALRRLKHHKKGKGLDPQDAAAKGAMDEKKRADQNAGGKNGDGSSVATSERDPNHGNKKAKKDNPKAPEPVIGMNDERGRVSSG